MTPTPLRATPTPSTGDYDDDLSATTPTPSTDSETHFWSTSRLGYDLCIKIVSFFLAISEAGDPSKRRETVFDY
ncbi:hypothetical protein F2Q69_00062413 [Brassica cretica]|uniref:Uncharacterized protein n=1 Tax=Brassica cretica TaxID=69181 RepID=A0A8S9RRF8_BRACR|nr:hypothetical protein F2Q69_00062413 [Brassica cretica]